MKLYLQQHALITLLVIVENVDVQGKLISPKSGEHYSTQRHKGEWGREPSVPTPFALCCSSTTPAPMFLLLFPTLMWNFMSRRWFHTGLFWGQWLSWAEVPFCLHEIPSTVCFWKQDLSCAPLMSAAGRRISRRSCPSAVPRPDQEPGMGHKINTGGMSTSKYQLLFPERRLRGDAALLWKIAHACKGTNINLQTKFKCLCDSRWRLKIASASGSAGTLVFMILLLFRNSKLDQWETLLSWPVVQFAARKYRHWNLTNYVNKYIAFSGGQSQNGKLVVLTNENQ